MLSLACQAQRQPAGAEPPTAAATREIRYSVNFPGSQPEFFSFAIKEDGTARYESRGQEEPKVGQVPHEPYSREFRVSHDVRQRLFTLAQQAGYFNADFEYKKGRVAFTGAKVLAYSGPEGDYQTKLNFSTDPVIQELVETFYNIAMTLESGRRMVFLRRFDKLGMDAELRNLEYMASSGRAIELHAIEPTLRQVANDASLMKMARERAQKLLARARRSQPQAAAGTGQSAP